MNRKPVNSIIRAVYILFCIMCLSGGMLMLYWVFYTEDKFLSPIWVRASLFVIAIASFFPAFTYWQASRIDKGKYTTNEVAAAIIRRFINGTSTDPYEWDDFESVKENNPAVDIALRLCWCFAKRFPAEKPTEYCARKAGPFFLKIADVLENNGFDNIDFDEVRASLEKNDIPENIGRLLGLSPSS